MVAELNAHGKLATVDVLGEEVADASEAEAIAAEYVAALDAFEREGLDANVSVKPTGLGLKLDYDLCKRNVETVIAAAEPTNRFVRIDMEDSSTTDDTLRLFRELRDEGHPRVGPVLQASLKRTVADAEALAGASVRICKGIYIEPEAIQFRDDPRGAGELRPRARDPARRRLRTRRSRPTTSGSSTSAERLIRERGLTPDRYEFQMLLGVRPELGDRIVADGHRLRIYVPYGQQWYEYSLRRLQENPKIAGYVAGDLGRSLFQAQAVRRRRPGGRRRSSSSTTVVRRGARRSCVRTGPPSTYAARRRKPPQLDQKIIEMTRPRRPTIIRITPIAFTSRPSASAVTPQVRIAPTAINRMLTEIPMAVLPPRRRTLPKRRASRRPARDARDVGVLAGHSSSPRSVRPGADDRGDELAEPTAAK